MRDPNVVVSEINYHRNGVSGEPFYAVKFTDPTIGEMLAVVFPPEPIKEGPDAGEADWGVYERGFHNPRVAVFQSEELPEVRFGHNSWRGDNYARALYEAIAEWEAR